MADQGVEAIHTTDDLLLSLTTDQKKMFIKNINEMNAALASQNILNGPISDDMYNN
jgi:hypothetical protein